MATRQQRAAPEKRRLEGKPPEDTQNLRTKGRVALRAGVRVCIDALKKLANLAATLADLGAYLVLKVARAAVSILAQAWRLLLWPIRTLPWWLNIGGAVLSVVATIVGLYEFFDEAVPYFEPDQATSISWHDLPFKLKVDSRIFGASDIQVLCAAENVTWKTNPKWGLANIKVNMMPHVERIEKIIPPHGTISFACNIADVNSITTADNQAAPIILIELHVQMTYRSFLWPLGRVIIIWPWERQTISSRFTWREISPGSYQWLEGEPRVP
jgi:hypothetical protein